MKKLKLLAFVFAGFAFAMVSCSKNSGTTGPAGPAGPAGPDSVIYSQWAAVSTPFFGLDANNDSVFEQVITAPAITQTILDQGLVLSYIQLADGTVSDVSDFSSFLDVYYAVGTITMDSYGIDLSQAGWNVRYVIISGSILAGNSFKQYSKAQLKAMTYSTVTKLLTTATAKPTTN